MKNSITIIWLQFTYYNVQNLTEFDIDEGILMWEQVILLVFAGNPYRELKLPTYH